MSKLNTKYPIQKDGDIEWSCIDAEDVMETREHSPTIRTKGWLEGPRWAHIEAAIKTVAWEHDVTVKTEVVGKGWFCECVLYEFTGPRSVLRHIRRCINETVEEYNKET